MNGRNPLKYDSPLCAFFVPQVVLPWIGKGNQSLLLGRGLIKEANMEKRKLKLKNPGLLFPIFHFQSPPTFCFDFPSSLFSFVDEFAELGTYSFQTHTLPNCTFTAHPSVS